MHILVIFLFSSFVFGHGGVKHKVATRDIAPVKSKVRDLAYKKINVSYLKQIKVIFKKSCFDCHGDQVEYPWYYQVPGLKQFIDQDISNAKEHLNFSGDYPFSSHETPINDLISIKKSILDDEMPPLSYRVMHPANKMTNQNKKDVIDWIDKSVEILKNE